MWLLNATETGKTCASLAYAFADDVKAYADFEAQLVLPLIKDWLDGNLRVDLKAAWDICATRLTQIKFEDHRAATIVILAAIEVAIAVHSNKPVFAWTEHAAYQMFEVWKHRQSTAWIYQRQLEIIRLVV